MSSEDAAHAAETNSTEREQRLDDNYEALRREATAYIVRLTSGEATTNDADALAEWQSRSERHEQAFRDAALLWKNLGPALTQWEEPSRPAFSRRTILAGGSLAASIVAGGVVSSQLGYLPPLNTLLSDYTTAIGQQRTINLPDGSIATLDGGSTLNLDYSPQQRRVSLSSGAGLLEVVEERSRPFVLAAGDGITTVSSASFAIKHGVTDVSVECLKGRISVECQGFADLVEGEQISYSGNGLGEKTKADVETAAAWRKGLLIFNNRPLDDVVADLNRHRRGKVVIARTELRSRKVSGVFHLDRPQEILAHLESTLGLRPVNLVGGIVFLR